MTTADFLIEDPFSGFSGEDKLKAHPKKFQKNSKKFQKKKFQKKIPKKNSKKFQKNSKKKFQKKFQKRPRRPAPAPEPIPMAGGRYGGLRDEVPRGDVEWDVGGGEDLDLDLEEFDISPPRGVRREAAERSRRRRDEEAYMEGVRREHLGSAYMEEPRRSHRDSKEEIDVAAVGVRGRGRWEPRSTSRPAFMVSKAADAAVWEDLKDISSKISKIEPSSGPTRGRDEATDPMPPEYQLPGALTQPGSL